MSLQPETPPAIRATAEKADDALPVLSPSNIHYEEAAPGVARVLVRVEYTDGSAREYEAREPQDFRLDEGMTTRRTGLSVASGGGGVAVSHAVPTLGVRFAAHPRHNLHIRTHGPWRMLSDEAHNRLAGFLAAMGYQAR